MLSESRGELVRTVLAERPESTYFDCFGLAAGLPRGIRYAISCTYASSCILLICVVTGFVMARIASDRVETIEVDLGIL